MKAYLHIGSHKTGTTALQSFALANRDWLAGRGLLYPGYDLIGGARSRSHLNMMAALSEDRVMPETSDPVRLLRAARQAAEERRCNLLFSAESLFRFGPAKIEKVCAALNELEGMKIVEAGQFAGRPFGLGASGSPGASVSVRARS